MSCRSLKKIYRNIPIGTGKTNERTKERTGRAKVYVISLSPGLPSLPLSFSLAPDDESEGDEGDDDEDDDVGSDTAAAAAADSADLIVELRTATRSL